MTQRPIWIYGPDGRGGPRWMARTLVVLAYLGVMAWTFFACLIRGMRDAFVYVYLEVRIAHADLAKFWHMGEPKR